MAGADAILVGCVNIIYDCEGGNSPTDGLSNG